LATLFHSHPDESRPPFFKLSAPPESGLLAANPRVINLYLAAQGFPSRIPHRSAEFVKHHPRGLVTRQTELALQKQGGYATLVSGHQIRRPEAIGQWNLRPVKNGPRCQRNLVPTLGALMAPLVHQFVGSFVPASRANEPIWPTTSRQILLAGLLGGKVGLKLAKRLGKRWSGHPLHDLLGLAEATR
jgi:hypothetical protein